MPINIDQIKLEYEDAAGAGKRIKAMLGQQIDCVEFTKRGDISQPITWTPKEPTLICSEPWIQFKPQEWSDMIEAIFKELVQLWNEKHGGKIIREEVGTIVRFNEKFESVEIKIASDQHVCAMHKGCCRGFEPKIGDLVVVIDTDKEWYIKKLPL